MYYFFNMIIIKKTLIKIKSRYMESRTKIFLSITLVIGHHKSNENKYLTLFPADESKDILQNNEKLWGKT